MRGFRLAILAAGVCLGCQGAGSAPGPAPALREGWSNGLIGDLIGGELASDRLGADAAIVAALKGNPATRGFLHYVTQCALPQGQSVVVDPSDPDLTFPGLIGMAPGWATGPCDQECQEWVSACVLARTNAYGVVVRISPQGENPALAASRSELPPNPVQEGAFFGNLFVGTPRAYACRGSGYDPLYMTFRRCSQPGNPCGIQNVGPCGSLDGDTGSASLRHACSEQSADGVAYTSCHNRATDPETGAFPEPSHEYTRVVTIYLPRSSMNDCDLPDPVVPEPKPGPPTPAGMHSGDPCTSDDDCASDSVTCDVQGPQEPLCTAACSESGDVADEARQCGGTGATCLTFASGAAANSHCTRACRPLAPAGSPEACEASQICTGYWYTHDTFEATGCAPFCSADSDCTRGAQCNPRNGSCGFPVDDTLLEDGEPCALDAAAPPCKGGCAPDGPFPGGLCASFIDLARTSTCPYLPARIHPVRAPAPDELAICAIKTCEKDSDCTPPLRCRASGPAVSGCLH